MPPSADERIRLDRLRGPEWLIGVASLVLIASLFLTWYGLRGGLTGTAARFLNLRTEIVGWDALTGLRWLVLVTGLCGIGVVLAQAWFRAPAVPVCLTVALVLLGIVCTVALINRVVISEPGGYSDVTQRQGAFVGLFSAMVLLAGAYRSLRLDGILPEDGPGEIETLRLDRAASA